ncbi:hypothetical protein SBA1_1030038 [Candidatus Sulfotelmatobacter kueseliae]|uniref:Helix-turn-helix domain-containing protein n=1 Tax=Candidatus Sulfotelmatobacter kueseliae TaxID=2042962 RepID=A0A2U3JXE2_9BACT|nr:hypothetical protein SBA1_1030038 [Candidatus Sulfotelmatobacter kueseliae]
MQETSNQGKGMFRTISALARDWGISRLTVQRMVDSGRLRTVRLNRRRLVHVREIQRVEEGRSKA